MGSKTYGGPARWSTGDTGRDLRKIGPRQRPNQALPGAFKRPGDRLLDASPDRAAAVDRRLMELEQVLALDRAVDAGAKTAQTSPPGFAVEWPAYSWI